MSWLWKGLTKEAAPTAPAVDPNAVRVSTITEELPILNAPECIFYYDPFTVEQRKKDEAVCPQFAAERAAFLAGGAAAVAPAPASQVPEPETPMADGEQPADWNDDESEKVDPFAASMSTPVDAMGDAELASRLEEEKALVEAVMAILNISYPDPAEDPNNQKRYKLQLDILRFLRARKMSAPDAAVMYKAAEEWFEKEKLGDMLATPDPLALYFRSITPTRNHGVDYYGNPVYYERTGMIVVGDLLKHMTEDDVVTRHIRYLLYSVDRMNISAMRSGKNVGKVVMIHDLAHLKFSIETAGVRIFKKTINFDQNYFPERLHRAFIINAPMSFRGAWAMVKPLLDPKTAQKIQILGANYKEALLECIPPSQLPAHYGGLCQCTFENDINDFCLPHKVRTPTDPEEELTPEWPLIIPRSDEQRAEAEAILAKAAAKKAAASAAAQ